MEGVLVLEPRENRCLYSNLAKCMSMSMSVGERKAREKDMEFMCTHMYYVCIQMYVYTHTYGIHMYYVSIQISRKTVYSYATLSPSLEQFLLYLGRILNFNC